MFLLDSVNKQARYSVWHLKTWKSAVKYGNTWSESCNEKTNDVFWGENARRPFLLMQLKLKLQKTVQLPTVFCSLSFRGNQTTNNLALNIIRGFEVSKKLLLMLWKPNNIMKIHCSVFSDYKLRNKMPFL